MRFFDVDEDFTRIFKDFWGFRLICLRILRDSLDFLWDSLLLMRISQGFLVFLRRFLVFLRRFLRIFRDLDGFFEDS